MNPTALTTLSQAKAVIRKMIAASLVRQYVDITGAYTIKPSDLGKVIRVTSGTFTITFPTNATTPLPNGFWVDIVNRGAGVVTLGGASITWERSAATLAQNKGATAQKFATDTWSAIGGLA